MATDPKGQLASVAPVNTVARRPCDIVMKGGVTSGVVYPAAVFEISQKFDIRSVGGTSAGAIAAALTAAAQYRRMRDAGKPSAEDGYYYLKSIPGWLAQDHHLLNLFKPNRATAALFNTVVGLVAPGRSTISRATVLWRSYPAFAMLGCLPGIAYAVAALNVPDLWVRVVHFLVAFVVLVAGSLACAVADFVAHVLQKVPVNQFGLVTGVDDGTNPNADVLCTWLTRELETIAGLEPGKVPLTFGMLWTPTDAATPNGIEDPPHRDERTVNLQMVTTCITDGRPYQFPTRTNRYYFNAEEMRKFFPDHVVTWMCEHSRKDARSFEDLTPLPPIGDLPIIVATRMSLAFPFLLSAVPLHAIDFAGDPAKEVPQHVWFSDGGISSNFPIAMFDAPIPSWPTLAINLGSFGPRTDPSGIIMAKKAGQGRLEPFAPVTSLGSFLSAILGTMQNWNDNVQAKLPGYRDRIVTVALRPDEGGLNLDMSADKLKELEARGSAAGKALIDRFAAPSDLKADPTALSWESHRWSRFRTNVGTLKEYLGRFSSVYRTPISPDVDYRSLIVAKDRNSVPCRTYPLTDDDQIKERIAQLSDGLSSTGADLSAEIEIDKNLPLPAPSIVTRPNLDR